MNDDRLRRLLVGGVVVGALAGFLAFPIDAMSAERTMLGELFTIPG